MKGRFMEWWRLILIAAMMGAGLFAAMNSSETGFILVQTLLMFSAVFCGYRFGPGAGAAAGSLCGVVLTITGEDPAWIGILCLLGLFAGAFRMLGRMASVAAGAAALFGAGVLYAPLLLFETMEAAAAGSAVFLLLPAKLTKPQETVAFEKETADRFREAARLPVGDRLRQTAKSFVLLSEMCRNENGAGLRDEDEYRDWRQSCIELRLMLSEHMQDCADILDDTARSLEERKEITGQVSAVLSEQLGRLGVRTHQMYMGRRKDSRYDLYLELSSKTARCVSMKLICRKISDVLGKSVIPSADQPLLVSAVPRCIRFEEECRYFTMSGTAGRAKNGNDTSGDSFSYMETDQGKSILILCDGMGSGYRAGEESGAAVELAEQLCRSGFSLGRVVRLINSILIMQGSEHPLTLDMCSIDRSTGFCEITKSGAAVTFLRRGSEVQMLGADTMPAGILRESEPMEKVLRLKDSDMIVMVSDGVLEALPTLDKEEAVCRFLSGQETANPRELAARLLRYASRGADRDDMTILAAGIWEK